MGNSNELGLVRVVEFEVVVEELKVVVSAELDEDWYYVLDEVEAMAL